MSPSWIESTENVGLIESMRARTMTRPRRARPPMALGRENGGMPEPSFATVVSGAQPLDEREHHPIEEQVERQPACHAEQEGTGVDDHRDRARPAGVAVTRRRRLGRN